MAPSTFDNPGMDARATTGSERAAMVPPARGRRSLLAALGAFVLALITPGCVLFTNPKGIAVSSTPPGATVKIASKDTGYVTPCVIDLDPEDDTRIDIELKGYMTETRYVSSDYDVYAILWRELSVGLDNWDFWPFFNFRDLFVPVKVSERVYPARIYVKLDRAADHVAPVSR